MLGPNGLNAPIVAGDDDYAVFGVWRATSAGAQRIWSQRSTVSAFNNGVSLSHYNDGSTNFWGNQAEIAPFTQTWTKPFQLGSWKISQLNLLAQDNDDQQVFDETSTNNPVISNTYNSGSGQGVRNLADESNSLGARNTPTEEAFIGEMTEIIVYDAAVLTPLTRQQVFSYLALKYGISKTGDYFASNGTTKFWDSTANTAFRFSVFGLGQDDNSGLLMSSSNSVETGTGNGTGQSGLGNIVLSAPSALSNLEFLMIGNNNAALAEQATDVPATADPAVRRFTREWKVQHTGTVGTVTLTFDFNGLSTTGTIGNVTHFRLMVDEDGDGDFTTGTIRYQQPSSFSGSVATFSNLILNTNEVFTIVTNAVNLPLPVSWKSFDAKVIANDVRLSWSVDNNADASRYEIEHSVDGKNFEKVGTVSNSASVKQYSYTHLGLTGGKHYYRLLQIDLDGKSVYSKVVDANIKASDFFVRALSNPVRNSYAEIEVRASKAADATVELWSVSGVRIQTYQKSIVAGTNRVRVDMTRAAAGNYILKVRVKDVTETIQLIKL
ncbi:MAG: T9SS type A sorting domain-containing protein [Gemmatimonadaceae bacterium]|nr:T9SS type A sorting domain-containing protein [Chitinophagaceae bacterium]